MLLASNNKSWSYLPPCLIKYLEKKTLWLIRLLHWSNIDCAPFCCPSWVNAKWWLSRWNKLLATTRAETKMNCVLCRTRVGAFGVQFPCHELVDSVVCDATQRKIFFNEMWNIYIVFVFIIYYFPDIFFNFIKYWYIFGNSYKYCKVRVKHCWILCFAGLFLENSWGKKEKKQRCYYQ